MFDPNAYQNACAQLSLGRDKREEIITMTENTSAKKRLSCPMKTVLIAAACVAALTVTAMAAPAVQQLFTTFTITYRNADSSTAFTMPTLILTEQGGRHILTVDDLETDVTDAFAQDGQYVMVVDGTTITVKPDGWVEVEAAGDQTSGPITYSYRLQDGEAAPGVGDVNLITDGTPEDAAFGSYSVSVDENGDIEVADYAPAQ